MTAAWRILFTALMLPIFSACATNPSRWVFDRELRLPGVSPISVAWEGDSIWVSDPGQGRILQLNGEGRILREYGSLGRPMHLSRSGPRIYFSDYLSDSIRFIQDGAVHAVPVAADLNAPAAVFADGGLLAIADFYHHRIVLQSGDSIRTLGRKGHGLGDLFYPTDVEISDSLLYVADAYNNRVQVFDLKGRALRILGAEAGIRVASGIGAGAGWILAADSENSRVICFEAEGTRMQVLSNGLHYPTDITVQGQRLLVANFQGESLSFYRLQ